MQRNQFRATIKNARKLALVKDGPTESTLYVYGVIGDDGWGDGISSLDFAKEIASAPTGTLHLRINSPGGDVFEGRAMAQALREYKGSVVKHIDGVAASAATFFLDTPGPNVMAKGSMLMIHNAWTVTGGNSDDLLSAAALLEKIDGQIANSYAAKAGVTVEQARAWMAAETWFTEQEAVDAKLADAIAEDQDGTKARATWDLSAYAKAPAAPAVDESAAIAKAKIDADAAQAEEDAAIAVANYENARRRVALFRRAA